MASMILVILLLLGFAALFVWLATRSVRSRRAIIKWPGTILSGLLGLVFLALAVVLGLGAYRLNVTPYAYQNPTIQIAMTQDQIQRGQQLAHICVGCHSPDGSLPLSGSQDNFMAGTPFGVLYAPNLTPAGPLKDWTDGEIIRALREGVDKDGRPLLIMPSVTFNYVSDEDAQALVAYLRSQPAVSRDLPVASVSPMGALLLGAGMFDTSAQRPITQPVASIPSGTAEHGKYLVNAWGCHDCHGPNMAGGSDPTGAQAPNITVVVPKWSQAEFLQFFSTGELPGGAMISDQMPRKDYRDAFTDQDLTDIYNYLHSLSPLPNG